MKPALDWIKNNIVIVVFAAVMIAAVPALLFFSGKLNAGIKEQVQSRVDKISKIDSLNKTNVQIGDRTEQRLVTEDDLQWIKENSDFAAADAREVYAAALVHNQKDRGVLMPTLFPEPPLAQQEVLPEQFHRRLMQAYSSLLIDIGAGAPPAPDSLKESIERQRAQFLTQFLQKDEGDPLDEQEQQQLIDKLSQTRMTLYEEAAERTELYVSIDNLYVPRWDPSRLPSMNELYDWQWQFWVTDDVLRALSTANREVDAGFVAQAPVKRVISLAVSAPPAAMSGDNAGGSPGGGSSGAPSGSMSGGMTGGGRRSGGAGASSGGDAEGAAVQPIAPKIPLTPDYAVSFTGRKTNGLYDVRYVNLRLVIDTARLPAVINALSKQNFITVLDLRMYPADHYAAAQQGYFFGSEPVAHVDLILETIWLRDWTSQFMPPDTRSALGVPAPMTEQPPQPPAPPAG